MREGSSSSGPTCCTAQVEATSTAIHCGGRAGRPLGRLLSPRSNDLNRPQRAQRAQRKKPERKSYFLFLLLQFSVCSFSSVVCSRQLPLSVPSVPSVVCSGSCSSLCPRCGLLNAVAVPPLT